MKRNGQEAASLYFLTVQRLAEQSTALENGKV